jgi:hypothetical protein
MPADHTMQAQGESGYAAMLARFRRQPLRNNPDIPSARGADKNLPPPLPAGRGAAPDLAPALKKTALQLRAAWLAFASGRLPADATGPYAIWRDACRHRHFSPLMCLDVVCHGLSPAEVDARYKMQSGTADRNLRRCLSLFGGDALPGDPPFLRLPDAG